MKFKISKLRNILFDSQRHLLIAKITSIFALLYHSIFLFVFLGLKVYPMFYFNIFSVGIFSTLTFLIFKSKKYKIFVPYFISYLEVIIHQICANYFLGGNTSFHFFILLIGLIAYLTFDNDFFTSSMYAIFASLLFLVLEILSPYMPSKFHISSQTQIILKSINIFLAISVILIIVSIFLFIVYHVEQNLEFNILKKSHELKQEHLKVFSLQNHIISSLASLVENRDTDTGEHIQRTSSYVELIARKALSKKLFTDTLNDEYIQLLSRAAPLHDIGKIIVPDSILKKPGKLNTDEFEQMKLHTTEGGRIINEVIGKTENPEFLNIASDIAKSHHEKWNGTGYPFGYSQEQIPLCARIMAIADVFDALVSPRCYKEPFPLEKAYEIIKEGAGTHFDPQLVEIFFSITPEIEKVLQTYTATNI